MNTVKIKDPAVRSYFFGKGFQDLRATIADGGKRNFDSAKGFIKKAPGWAEPMDVIKSSIWYAIGISILFFGSIFYMVASALHILLLGLFFIAIFIGFTGIWMIERWYLAIRSFFLACPHCHANSNIPEYFCDQCGEIHAQMLPNSYGVFFHRCLCGNKLPATFFLDRGRLQARCPVCHENIAREHVESRRIFVPVMGGPSTGKSAFLFGAVRQLVDHGVGHERFKAKPFDKRSEDAFRRVESMLRSGIPPDKTRDPIPRAFNLGLHKNGRLSFLLYLYDPAGEAYQEADKLSEHGFNNYLSGMILIVDPFAIPSVRSQYRTQLEEKYGAVKPSELSIEEVVDRLLMTLEADFGLSKRGKVSQPLAIVLNKSDAFGLESLIGAPALDRVMAQLSEKAPPDRNEARNRVLRNQLVKWGEQAFVSRIEARFSLVSYFACSALGRMPDRSKVDFTAKDVLPPLLWIFGKYDRANSIMSAKLY